VVFIYSRFHSATKKNEILSFTGKWMELENIILSEVSQAQKAQTHMQIIDLKQMQSYYWTWVTHYREITHGGIGKRKEI
jgi:hypothetical protein